MLIPVFTNISVYNLKQILKKQLEANFKEIGWNGADCINLAQDMGKWPAFMNPVNEPLGSIECREFFCA